MSELSSLDQPSLPSPPLVQNFFEESPILSREQDTLFRYPEAQRLARECQVAAEQSPSCVIGLVGEFGIGKSSVAAMTQEELRKDPRWQTINFDPYMCLSPEGVVMDFFTTMAEAFDRLPRAGFPRSIGRLGVSLLPGVGPRPKEAWEGLKHAWEQRKISDKLGSFLMSLGPFASALNVSGIDAGKAAEAVGKRLAEEPSARSKKDQLAKQLQGADKNILVTIDDIDRLQPDQQALMFNLLRVTSGLPKVYFLLLLHEPSVFQALIASKTVENMEEAQGFMERFIQFRHEMPPLDEQALEKHVLSKFDALSKKYEHGSERMHINRDRFTIMYREAMRRYLVRPRLINRFFAEIDADVASMPGQVNIADYCGIHFLRRFVPPIYELIQKEGHMLLVPENDTIPLLWMPEERDASGLAKVQEIKDNREKWEQAIKQTLHAHNDSLGPADAGLVKQMLAVSTMLFPDALNEPEGYAPPGPWGIDMRAGPWKGVSDRNLFNRYLNRGLNPAERAQMLAGAGLIEVLEGQQNGPAATRLVEALRAHPSLTITGMNISGSRLLRSFPEDSRPAEISKLLTLLDFTVEQYMHLLHTMDDESFLREEVTDITRLSRRVLGLLPASARQATMQIFSKHDAVSFVGNLIGRLPVTPGQPEPDSWQKACRDFLKARQPQSLYHMLSRQDLLERVPANDLVSVLFTANVFAGPGEVAHMIWSQYLQPGRISLETLLAKILVLDPRRDYRLHGGPQFLPDPPSIQREIRYKLRLLFPDITLPDMDILQANKLIIDTLLGLERTMSALPPFILHPDRSLYPPRTDQDLRLWDVLTQLQREHNQRHMPPRPE